MLFYILDISLLMRNTDYEKRDEWDMWMKIN